MTEIGFEEQLWALVDRLRNNMDASEDKQWCQNLYFLYVSDRCMEKGKKLN